MSTAQEKPAPAPALPDHKVVDEVAQLEVVTENNKSIKFGDLFLDQAPGTRQLIVFIRHFFCGNCEQYIQALAKDLPPATLAASNIKLSIIGCGEAICIPDYKKRTECPYEIYADPSRAIYTKFGMAINLKFGKKPEYMTLSLANTVFSSIWNGITSGRKGIAGGKTTQNGGEAIFQDGKLIWFHKMTNTGDHTEVKDLKKQLSIE